MTQSDLSGRTIRIAHLAVCSLALLSACSTLDGASREELRRAQSEGRYAGDACADHGLYGDGVCDAWCPSPDPDCGSPCEIAGLRCASAAGTSCPSANVRADLSCSSGGTMSEAVCCDDAIGTPSNPCTAAGHVCAPFGPAGVPGIGCPAGTMGIELSCNPAAEEICCAATATPTVSACEAAGHTCAPYGPVSEGFGCPAGTTGDAALSCSVAGGPVVEEICCVATSAPTTPCEAADPANVCAEYGPVSEGLGCPAGTVGSPLSCQPAGGPVVEQVCCVPAPSDDCRASGCAAGRHCEACSMGYECVPDGASC